MKFSENTYLEFDPFGGYPGAYIKNLEIKVIKTRKPCKCAMGGHGIKVGSKARYESVMISGGWCRSYACIPCMDKWFKEIGLKPDGDKN